MSVDKYLNAAQVLAARGEPVTFSSVRSAVGGGSFSTIGQALRLFRARAPVPESASPPMPPNVSEAAGRIWQIACDTAQDQLAAERKAFETARNELTAQYEELAATADTYAERAEVLDAELMQSRQALAESEQRALALAVERDALRHIVEAHLQPPSKKECDTRAKALS